MHVLKNTFWGETVDSVMKKAQAISKQIKDTVEFEFNERKIRVDADTDLTLLSRDYNTSWVLDWKVIENPVKEYSQETLDAITEAERIAEERRLAQQLEWERKDKLQQDEFNAKVVGVELSLSNKEIWDDYVEKNQDPYGKCAVDYARDWGRLMQYYMSNGESIQQCAERASHELGWYGITGFMYGAAVQMLSQCWKHGEELRKWHNKEYNHEGDGVVNPAILTINPN